MNGITEKLLGIVSDWAGSFNGAFNIRENGQCAGRQSTAHIKIESKTDVPGLDIRILPGTKGESVSIPACVTHGDVDDLDFNNDFFVGDGSRRDHCRMLRCAHRRTENPPATTESTGFFWDGTLTSCIWKSISVRRRRGKRSIDPVTEATLAEGAILEMDTSQLGGVDDTTRTTRATLAAGAKAVYP